MAIMVLSSQKVKSETLLKKEKELREEIISYLITAKGYPKGLLMKEGVQQGKTKRRNRRVDILVSCLQNHTLCPLLLIECKRQKPGKEAYMQLLGYNSHIQALWCALVWPNSYVLLKGMEVMQSGEFSTFPTFDSLLQGDVVQSQS